MTDSLWITRDELRKLTGLTVRSIERRLSEGDLKARETAKRSKNGRAVREFWVGSLSPELQREFMRQRLAEAKSDALQHANDKQGLLPFALGEAEQRLIITEEQARQARQREGIIRPMIDCDGSVSKIAKEIIAKSGIPHGTLWRWYSNYKKLGFAGLADRVRADKGSSRFFQEHPKAAKLAQAKYLHERLSIQLVHEALCREWPKLYSSSEPPSYSTVRAYLQSLPNAVTTLAREGERAFDEKCAPYLARKIEATVPNQIWVSDHCKHDVWVRNDGFFAGIDRDAALRPWLTAIIDMRSRKIVGCVWNATPSSHTISSAIHGAVLENGIPETFLIDNGKDFEKVGKIGVSQECSGVLVRLAIKSQYCRPMHPQSKLIESWFALMHKRFDTLWGAFYCGTSPATRPDACNRVLVEHKRWIDGKAKTSPLPTAQQFCALAEAWIRNDYNCEYAAHSGRGMNGRTPSEVFDGELDQDARRTVQNPETLYELLWDRKKRRVMEGGTVQLYNGRFEAVDVASKAEMLTLIGRDVAVACDPLNLGEAIVLNEAGIVVARLEAQKLVEHGPVSQDDIRASMRQRRSFRRAIREYVAAISADVPSEIDVMRERHAVGASLPPPRVLEIAAQMRSFPRLTAAKVGYDDVPDTFFGVED